jgi:pentatricopeptide repeat protein
MALKRTAKFIGTLSIMLLAWCHGPVAAQPADDTVARARSFYGEARFQEAIDLVQGSLKSGSLTSSEAQAAREILARSYVRIGDSESAVKVFQEMLESSPGWRPDETTVPPDEVAVFQTALQSYRSGQTPAPTPEEQAAAGEDRWAWGIYAGAGLGKLSGQGIDDYESSADAGGGSFEQSSDIGPTVGVKVGYRMNDRLSLQGEVAWKMTKGELTSDLPGFGESSQEWSLTSVEIPVLAKFRLGSGGHMPAPYGGFSTGIILDSEAKNHFENYGDPISITGSIEGAKDLDFGFLAGLEVPLFRAGTHGIKADLRYRHGLSDAIESESSGSYRRSEFGLLVGIDL